jgi:hypothetical protein
MFRLSTPSSRPETEFRHNRRIVDTKRKAGQEKLGPAISKVKEDFYRAFDLIMGYPLEAETLRSLQARLGQVSIHCGDCPE